MRQDRFIIITGDSQLELNPSFTMASLHPGGVDTSALYRREGSVTAHRTGDGLRTPGPFILTGHVWNDSRDARAARVELMEIQAAVAAAQSVLRDTPAGQWWYSGFMGGPLPEVLPDGNGGYRVQLEFWPARAVPVNLPPSNATPLLSQRTPSNTFFPEYFLTRGPRAIGDTGAGEARDYAATAWALSVASGSRLVTLWRQDNGNWERIPTPGHPIIDQAAPSGARRFSIAFDQVAQPAVAYELAGTIFITRFDPLTGDYVQNVSVPGVDPVLILDATWHGSISGSDLLLFHLSSDRAQVQCRVQSEVWAVPHLLHSYESPVILDRVLPLLFRYQLLVSDSTGEALDEQLLSAFYPVPGEAGIGATGTGPVAGSYQPVVIPLTPVEDHVRVSATGPASGLYSEAILQFIPPVDALAVTAAGPESGSYSEAIVFFVPAPVELSTSGAGPEAGDYTRVAISVPGITPDTVLATGTGPSGGSYAEA